MTILKSAHKAADAMDWNEAMQLIDKMYGNGQYRESQSLQVVKMR